MAKQIIGIDQRSGRFVAVDKDGKLVGATPGGNIILGGRVSGIAPPAPGSPTIGSAVLTTHVDPRAHIEEAIKILGRAWRSLQHSNSKQDRMWVIGHIEAFRDLGVLNELEYKGWLLQLDLCPGHAKDFNPADCAYCAPRV